MSDMVETLGLDTSKDGASWHGKENPMNGLQTAEQVEEFASGSGDKRGHEKTPSFMAGMKCLPHRHVLSMSAANNCIRPTVKYIY